MTMCKTTYPYQFIIVVFDFFVSVWGKNRMMYEISYFINKKWGGGENPAL